MPMSPFIPELDILFVSYRCILHFFVTAFLPYLTQYERPLRSLQF